MNNKNGFALVPAILIVAAALIIGGGAYYLGSRNSNLPPAENSQNGNGNQGSGANLPANWQTYKGNGFEVSYPFDKLKLTEEKEKILFNSSDKGVVKGSGASFSHSVPTGKTSQDKCPNPDSGLPEPCKTELIDAYFGFYGIDQDLNSVVNKVNGVYGELKPAIVNNLEGFSGYIYTPEPPHQMYYFLPLGSKKTIVIRRVIYPSDKTLFDEVVATLKSTTADTTNWKTYRNDTYGFEFAYPKDSLNGIPFQNSLFENLSFFQGDKNPSIFQTDTKQNRSKVLDGVGLSHEVLTGKSENDTCYGEFSGLPQPCSSKVVDTFFTFLVYNDKYENSLHSILGTDQSYGKKITINGRSGFFYDSGFEGSGELYYFLPINTSRTLIIVRQYKYEFDKGEHGAYNQKLFDEVIKTLKFF